MPRNTSEDLNNLLFETIERLMDNDDPMEIKRAEAVAKTAQVIVNNAKTEFAYMKQNKEINGNPAYFASIDKRIETRLPAVITQNKIQPKQLVTITDKCAQHAQQFGHSTKEAEECENFSVGCPNCPFGEGDENA